MTSVMYLAIMKLWPTALIFHMPDFTRDTIFWHSILQGAWFSKDLLLWITWHQKTTSLTFLPNTGATQACIICWSLYFIIKGTQWIYILMILPDALTYSWAGPVLSRSILSPGRHYFLFARRTFFSHAFIRCRAPRLLVVKLGLVFSSDLFNLQQDPAGSFLGVECPYLKQLCLERLTKKVRACVRTEENKYDENATALFFILSRFFVVERVSLWSTQDWTSSVIQKQQPLEDGPKSVGITAHSNGNYLLNWALHRLCFRCSS